MTTNNSYPLSMYDVSRLAPESIDVIQRNADKPAIAVYTAVMVPVAHGVLAAIQELAPFRADQLALIARSDEQTAVLNGLMLEWTGRLVRDLEGFDIGAFMRKATLTFDVLQKASGLKQLVEQKGADLPYREALLAELTARIEGTSAADRSAHAARVALQEKQRAVQELINTFYKELISLRRTVRAALGSSHLDYQCLRTPSRADESLLESDPVTEPSEPETESSG